jgi:hypothetical protein
LNSVYSSYYFLCFLFFSFIACFARNQIPLSLFILFRDGGGAWGIWNMPTPLGGPRLTESLDSSADRSRMFQRLRLSKIRTF